MTFFHAARWGLERGKKEGTRIPSFVIHLIDPEGNSSSHRMEMNANRPRNADHISYILMDSSRRNGERGSDIALELGMDATQRANQS